MRIGIAHPFLRTRRDDRQRTAVRPDHARGASDSEAITRIFKKSNAETHTDVPRARSLYCAQSQRNSRPRHLHRNKNELHTHYVQYTIEG